MSGHSIPGGQMISFRPVQRPVRARRLRGNLVAREHGLPSGIPPRLLSRDAAAHYVGLSATAFNMEFAAGTFPAPFRLKRVRRNLWDAKALDAALDRDASPEGAANDIDPRERAWEKSGRGA